jgi:hypothetical protein
MRHCEDCGGESGSQLQCKTCEAIEADYSFQQNNFWATVVWEHDEECDED